MIEVEKLINWIDDDIKENRHDSSLDLELPLQFCVGNIISSIVLGHSFEKDDPHFVHLKEIVDENFRLLSDPKTGFLQAFPWFRFVPYLKRISNYDAFCRLDKIFRKFLDGEIEWNKKNVDMEKDATNYTTAYLKELNKRQTSEESTGSFSEWQLHFTLADLWIAGMETTVTTLKWAFLYLILNPDVQEKIFKEIQSVIGSDKKPQLTDKVNMPYTQAAINEIQRMGNIVPINLVHTVFQDTQVGKYRIPEGVVVIPQISSVHMDADYFPDPDKFDPKRYLDSDEKSITKIDQLVPFSMGKRICLGESLAKMELFLIITSMVQRYKFEIPFGEPEPSTKPVRSFTSSPQKYKCSISKRNL
jgi:cytochrome P450